MSSYGSPESGKSEGLALTFILDFPSVAAGPSAPSLGINITSSSQETNSKEAPATGQVAGSDVKSPSELAPDPQQGVALRNSHSPSIPLRSSSNPSLQPLSTAPIAGQSADASQIQQPESKGSTKAGSRSGSTASSGRLRKAKKTPPNPSAEKDNLETVEGLPPQPKHRKKVPKFLAFLNCCSAAENANSGDQPIPAKKAGSLQEMHDTQATTVVNPNVSAADSSVVETKEAVEDNMGGPLYTEHTLAAKPVTLDQPPKDSVPTEKIVLQSNEDPVSEKEEQLGVADQSHSLARPTDSLQGQDSSHNSAQQTLPEFPVVETVEIANPRLPDDGTADHDITMNDKTSEPETNDADVTMVDAPSPSPQVEEQSVTLMSHEGSQPQISLPPPPPRAGPDRILPGIGRSPSNAVVPNEKQQWLLPPVQPQFKGKKCLVLDLDETLVHSSFKVGVLDFSAIPALIFLDTSPGRLYNPCRN